MKVLKAILVLAVVFISTAFTVNYIDGYKVGDTAEDFKLKNVDGNMVSLADYKEAKGFIVIFTCNMCPYSKMYEDRIVALDKKFKAKGYPVIAINPNDPAASPGDDYKGMIARAKSKGFTFPYLFDKGQKVYPKFGASRTPHVYILNKENKTLKVKYIGAIDNNARNASKVSEKYVEEAVHSLLKGEDISKKETKAIGCSIKTN